jgi:ProP effector
MNDATLNTGPVSGPPDLESASVSGSGAPSPKEFLRSLQAAFPVFQEGLPLIIGIDKALRAHFPDLSRKILRATLGMHTHSTRYLRLMSKATHRFDLEGNPAAELTEEHRQYALETLRERLKKQAEHRKAMQLTEETERHEPDAPASQGKPLPDPGVDDGLAAPKIPASAKKTRNIARSGKADQSGKTRPLTPHAPPEAPSSPTQATRTRAARKPEVPKAQRLPETTAPQMPSDTEATHGNGMVSPEKLAQLAAKFARK